MSIQLSVTVYGPQLVRELSNDGEEMGYFFNTLVDETRAERLGGEISGYIQDPTEAVAYLRALADKIEADTK